MLAIQNDWTGQKINSGDILTPAERKWVTENPIIRVGNEMDWPPFDFNENGYPRGFSVD